MKHFFSVLFLGLAFSASTPLAQAQIVFDGSPGNGPPPPALGGYTMTPIVDTRENFSVVSSVESPLGGAIEFRPMATIFTPQPAADANANAQWGNGYTGRVYVVFQQMVTLALPAQTKAFYFYAIPATFGTFNIEATAQDGTTSGAVPVTLTSDGGAKYFGFYTNQPGVELKTITITAQAGSQGLVFGQLGIAKEDVSCGPGGRNVKICYYGVEQCVPEKIAKRYLRLGATMGSCDNGNNAARLGVEETDELGLALKAFPNPVQDLVMLEVRAPQAGPATFEVLDLTGRTQQSRREELTQGLNEVEFRLGTLPTGTYLIRVLDAQNRQAVERVSKQ